MTLADIIMSARKRMPARVAAMSRYDLAVWALLATLVVLVFATYGSYAISNDEEVQQRYGELIVAYYTSGLTDQIAVPLRSTSISMAGCSTSSPC